MFLGLITTIFLIPDTRGTDGWPLTLEALAEGDENGRPNNLLNRLFRSRREGAEANLLRREEEERNVAHGGSREGTEFNNLVPDRSQYGMRMDDEGSNNDASMHGGLNGTA
jgi:hypothetical protein